MPAGNVGIWPAALGCSDEVAEIRTEAWSSAVLCFVAPNTPMVEANAPRNDWMIKTAACHTTVIGRYNSHQPGPYRIRRKKSQLIVITRIQKALSRYQVSDFCECKSVETREREDDNRVSSLV